MIESKRPIFRGRELRMGIDSWTPFSNVERAVLAIACLACGGCCVWVGSLLGIPREPTFNGSLLLGGSAVGATIAAAVSIAICMGIGVFITALFSVETALFCCCIGLAFFAVRCGPIRPVLQHASGKGAFLALSAEAALLGTLLVGGWFGLSYLFQRMHSPQTPALDRTAPNELTDGQTNQKLATLGVQMIGMILCEQILIQTDVQAQAMAGVMISGFAGSVAAYIYRPMGEGIWYWAGPILTGVVAYLLAFYFSDSIAIGDLRGWTGPLARPTPLMYIGMGTAGAILGHWCIRRWSQPEAEHEAETAVQSS